ncbi:MAG: hypothetical protein ACI9YE_000889 [Psychroserpens sp.]|jgi:hypothetical protein
MKWNFRKGGRTENPKDAGIKEFSKHIFESLVRESVQNSLDNPIGDEPVIVEFNFNEIEKSNFPDYQNLETHLHACYDYWKDQAGYESLLKRIIDRVDSFDTVPVLQISDYNTKGMDISGNEDIRKTKYFAFSRGNNSVHDDENSGGSEGQGKAALYAVAALRTIFVHSVSQYGSIFEGLTRFSTHRLEGTIYSSDGHLGNDLDSPNYESGNVASSVFHRENVLGTTISIAGIWGFQNARDKMIKSALNNFWFAIYDGDLIIKIDDLEINKDNLESLIVKYLPDLGESNRTRSNPTEYGRVRCYFNTWSKDDELTEKYAKKLSILGNCELKIAMNQEYPGKIAFFRKQKMLIVRSGVNSFISKGYCGVFICKDIEGNKTLRKMEGKTHTEWDPHFYTEDIEKGRNAIQEMNEFIKSSWRDYRAKHFPPTLDLKGLNGISLGGSSKGAVPETKKPTPKKPIERKLREKFEKTGVINKGLKSNKVDGFWSYTMKLSSRNEKTVKIELLPATDSERLSKNELLRIIEVSPGWTVVGDNIIIGELNEGDVNEVNVKIDSSIRLGLNCKVTNYEV